MGGEVHQARDAGVDLVTSQLPHQVVLGVPPRGAHHPLPQLPAYAGGGLRKALWLGVVDASGRTGAHRMWEGC